MDLSPVGRPAGAGPHGVLGRRRLMSGRCRSRPAASTACCRPRRSTTSTTRRPPSGAARAASGAAARRPAAAHPRQPGQPADPPAQRAAPRRGSPHRTGPLPGGRAPSPRRPAGLRSRRPASRSTTRSTCCTRRTSWAPGWPASTGGSAWRCPGPSGLGRTRVAPWTGHYVAFSATAVPEPEPRALRRTWPGRPSSAGTRPARAGTPPGSPPAGRSARRCPASRPQ